MEKTISKAAVFACCFVAFPLAAGAVSTNETFELEPVTVYASRIDAGKDSIPSGVNIFDSSDIADSTPKDLNDFLRKKANIHIRTMNSNPLQSQIAMRGFGENSFGRVKVIFDGEDLGHVDMSPQITAGIAPEDIERIEIIHGPSPVLHGDGASAGVINIETSPGDCEKKTRVTAKAGSQYTFGAGTATKGGSEEDGVAYKAFYDYSRSDGYRDKSAYELHSTGANLRKNFENGSYATFKTTYRNAFYEMPGALAYSSWKDSRKKAAYLDDWTRMFSYSAAFDSKIFLADGQWLYFDVAFSETCRKTNWGDYGYANEYDLYEISVSPRYVNENDILNRANKFTAGTDFRYDLYRTTDNSWPPRTKPCFDRFRGAVFARDEFFLTDSLSLVAGTRGENIDSRWTRTSAVREHNINDWMWSWEAGFVYRPIEDLRTWAKSTRFFKSPFCDELSYTENGEALKPESGYSVDIGAEFAFDEEFTVDANAYAMFIDDEIFYNPYAKDLGAYWGGYNCNSPSGTRRFGIDAGLSWEREDVADASVKYGIASARFDGGQYDGKDIPMDPNHFIRAEAAYWVASDIKVKCGFSYTGPQRFASDFNNEHGKLPGYSLFDAGILYTPSWAKGWKASAVIDNIFDREYCDFAGWSDYSGAYCYPACGRSFMFSLSCEF